MRGAAIVLTLAATPALAHHEVVVVTSMVPVMLGVAVTAVAGLAALRQKLRNRR